MGKKIIALTLTERTILESYKGLVTGLADYLGVGCEIVLHSMEDLDHSVIKIVNGEHTGRKEGAPITDLALSMLTKIQEEGKDAGISYLTRNRKGEPLKSCTIPIYGNKNRVIGLLCINYYLNTTIQTLIDQFIPKIVGDNSVITENFALDPTQLVENAVLDATNTVMLRQEILPSNKNKEIIALLEKQGIFKMKDSVVLVAEAMGISKNTVYMHLRNMR